MMGIDTATVETLTAEVRVLMVGNRQITLSVARQLDRVDWRRLNKDGVVFGRCRLSAKGEDSLIGRGPDGTLVTASLPDLDEFVTWEQEVTLRFCRRVPHPLPSHQTFWGRWDIRHDQIRTLEHLECPSVPLQIRSHERTLCNCAELEPCNPRMSPGDIYEFMHWWTEDDPVIRHLRAQPLIVLAGLK